MPEISVAAVRGNDNQQPSVKKNFYGRVLVLLVILWVAIIGYLKYDLYRKGILTSDMALYPNILWNTNLHGSIMYNKMLFDWYGYTTALNEHAYFTLLLLIPIYRLLPHPLTLVFIQTLVVGASAFIIYLFAKQFLNSSKLALVAAAAFLLHPSLVAATIDNVYGFHHDSLMIPLVLGIAYFFYKQKFVPFFVLLVLLFGLKENMPLAGLVLGGVLLFSKERRRLGWGVLAVVAFFLVIDFFVLPFLTGARNHHSLDVLETIRSATWHDYILNFRTFLFWLVLPILFFPALWAPEILIIAAPDLVMYFYAHKWPFYHHVFFVYVIFVVAAVVGLKKMLANDKIMVKLRSSPTKFPLISLVILFVLGDFFVAKQYLALEKKFNWRKIDMEFVAEVKKSVPNAACLVTTSDLPVYFVNRPCLSWSEKSLDTADFILINKNSAQGFDYDKAFVEKVEDMIKNKQVFVAAEKGDMVLLKK